MKLIVLGNYGPYPKAGGACSGFLLDSGEHKILIDCGSGVVGRLLQFAEVEELSAVLLSHLHSDHSSDMLTLGYAANAKDRKGLLASPIKVYAPQEPTSEYSRIAERGVFEMQPIKNDLELNFGELRVTFRQMKHGFENYAMCFEKGNRKFVYSGDTMPNEELVEFASHADLFLCEAGLLEREDKCVRAMHMTAKEAGEIAERAHAKRLLLTHFLPDTKIDNYVNEASSVYNGIMEIAGENRAYFI